MTTHARASEDWPDWLRLVTTPGVSTRQLRQLLSVFGGPSQVLAASEADRAHWVGAAAAAALSRPPADAPLRRARTQPLERLSTGTGSTCTSSSSIMSS